MPTDRATREDEEFRTRERLRFSIEAGVAALERGDYTEVKNEYLDDYLDSLLPPRHR
jgi:hypothetical protein